MELFLAQKYNYFSSKKSDRIKLFRQNGLEISGLLEEIEWLKNHRLFETINLAFWQLESTLNLCDFLWQEKIQKNHDTEKIIITILVSLTEGLYQMNKPYKWNSENQIRWFLKPVSHKLKYKFKFCQTTYESWDINEIIEMKKDDAIYVLYLIRNDYIHNANFLWRVFGDNNSFSIHFFWKNKKFEPKTIQVMSNIQYNEFLSIFLEAFMENTKKAIKKTSN